MINPKEKEQMKQVEHLHKTPEMKKQFHEQIAKTTLWRFCVWCGEPIKREKTT